MSVTIGCRPSQYRNVGFGDGTPRPFKYLQVLDGIEDLPTILKPDAVYFVRDGDSIDMYVVNSDGSAYEKFEITNEVFTVDSIAELKTYRGFNDIAVIPRGYYEQGDGGGVGQYYWDQDNVETDNGGTIIQATGVATGRWVSLNKNKIDVKSFGVKSGGGSVDATENTIRIQKAIDYLSSIGGGQLYFPVGTYYVDQTITIPSYINIFGENDWNLANSFSVVVAGDAEQLNSTIIYLDDNSNCNVFEFDSLSVSSTINKLFIHGNKANQTSGNGIEFINDVSINLRSSNKVNEVYAFKCKENGFKVNNKCYEIYFLKTYADRCDGNGYYILGQDCSLIDSLAGYNALHGFEIAEGGAIRSFNCDSFGNTLTGLYIHDTKTCRFVAFQSNGNKRQGVLVAHGGVFSPSRIQFLGCNFFGNSTEYLTSTIRYTEFEIGAAGLTGPFGVLLTNCAFGIFAGTTYCDYAIADNSGTVRVNSIVGCNFEGTVYSTAIFNNIERIYHIIGCTNTASALEYSIALGLVTNTKVASNYVPTESLGYDYKTATFNIDAGKRFTAVSAAGGAITATLPLANTLEPGKEVIIRKHDGSANVITVAIQGGNAFASGSATTLTTQGQIRRYITDGVSSWFNSN